MNGAIPLEGESADVVLGADGSGAGNSDVDASGDGVHTCALGLAHRLGVVAVGDGRITAAHKCVAIVDVIPARWNAGARDIEYIVAVDSCVGAIAHNAAAVMGTSPISQQATVVHTSRNV